MGRSTDMGEMQYMGSLPVSAANTRTIILEAAYRTLVARGYAGTSLRDIAREAGVALSQLHYYFSGKEGLLAAVVQEVTRRHLVAIFAEMAGAGPRDRIRVATEYLRRKLDEEPGWAHLYFDLHSLALWNDKVRGQVRQLHAELATAVEQEVAAVASTMRPALSRHSPAAIGRMIIAALDGIALRALVTREDEDPTLVYAAFATALEELLLGTGEPPQ